MKQDTLKKYLYYDNQSGNFYWIKVKNSKTTAGQIAGCKTKHGYVAIGIDNKRYYAHRLAWLYVYGYMPKILDHINKHGLDNRISNLRECTQAENMKNISKPTTNTSGYKGVSWAKNNKKWVVYARHEGVTYNLGYYDDKLDAANVYKEFALKHHKQFITL